MQLKVNKRDMNKVAKVVRFNNLQREAENQGNQGNEAEPRVEGGALRFDMVRLFNAETAAEPPAIVGQTGIRLVPAPVPAPAPRARAAPREPWSTQRQSPFAARQLAPMLFKDVARQGGKLLLRDLPSSGRWALTTTRRANLRSVGLRRKWVAARRSAAPPDDLLDSAGVVGPP
jgi:hypothetical protein